MLERLNLAVFTEYLLSRFRAYIDPGEGVDLELTQARDLGSTPRQEQFSLLFRGPQEPFLPQRLYRMEHEQLGSFDLFLVPVGQTEDGFEYEAVFNRLPEGKQ